MKYLENINLIRVNVSDLNGLENSKDLKRIDIGAPKETGFHIESIPDLSNFSKLELLIFNSKYTKGIKGIEYLNNLKRLHVGSEFNYKGIDFPDSLEYLHLAGFDNDEMPNLSGNVKLKELGIARTNITEVEGLFDLIELEKFNLVINKVEEISGLNNLKNLKKLNLSRNRIKKIEGISHLKKLEKIDLQYNEIEKIEGFENLPNLESILLGHNKINKINKIDSVNFMTWLDVLSLHHNPIDTFDYQSIAGLENTKLIFRDTPLSDILTDKEKEKYYDTHRYLRF